MEKKATKQLYNRKKIQERCLGKKPKPSEKPQ